jgi:hypothetical protein
MKQLLATALLAATLLLCVAGTTQAQQALGTNAVVTQITSATTGVAINGNSGVITTVSLTNAAGVATKFTVTNPAVNANSTVLVGVVNYAGAYSTNGIPIATVNNVVAGAFDVNVINAHSANALNNVVKVGFMVF